MRDAFWDLVVGGRCTGCARPGRLLCERCRAALPIRPEQALLTAPDPCPPGLAPTIAATVYDGTVRRMVLAHKERRALALTAPLGGLLAVAAGAALHDWPAGARALMVPVPGRAAATRARGHDPLARIVAVAGRVLAGGDGAPLVVPLLRRRRRVADQRDLDAAGRAANLAGAFTVRDRVLARVGAAGVPVAAIVCDDVLTTGSTAREAQRALEDAGVPVAAIAVVAATRRRPRDVGRDLPGSLPISGTGR